MRKTWMCPAVVTFSLLALSAMRTAAQAVQPNSDSYSWSGELVAFDPTARTLTVKSRVVGDQALADLPHFKAGDRIVLTWSGIDRYADAISRAVRYDAAKKWSEPFTFAVEFVAYEAPRQYVTFKSPVPVGSVDALKAVKPGEWVTATSRHRPSSEAEAITAVRAYTATSHASAN